jgi:hypothetical protein
MFSIIALKTLESTIHSLSHSDVGWTSQSSNKAKNPKRNKNQQSLRNSDINLLCQSKMCEFHLGGALGRAVCSGQAFNKPLIVRNHSISSATAASSGSASGAGIASGIR